MVTTRNFTERRINHFLFLHRAILEDLLSSNLIDLQLEKSYKGRRIDLFAIHESRKTPIFIEVQKNRMDLVHFKQIKTLIQLIQKGIIIWISTKAENRYIDDLVNLTRNSNKKIEILIVEIEEEAVSQINDLLKYNPYCAIDRYKNPEFSLPKLHLNSRIATCSNFSGRTTPKSSFEGNEEINRKILYLLREKYFYFDNVLRYKSDLDRRKIRMGSGTSFITIELTVIPTTTEEAKLELYCSKTYLYRIMDLMQDDLRKVEFSSRTSFEVDRFTIHYGKNLATEQVFEKIIPDFGKLIHVLMEFFKI